MYAYSDMDCLHRHNFLSFQAIFCFFAQLLTTTIIMWQKCKKTPGYIILLHMCTINQDHMMYGSWDMKFNRQNFLYTLKNENIKNEKTPGDIIILHKCTKNHDHLLYTVPEIWHMADVIVIFILGYQTFFQALFYNR